VWSSGQQTNWALNLLKIENGQKVHQQTIKATETRQKMKKKS